MGRPLSERETFLVQNMREQARISGEITLLQSRNRQAYRTPAAQKRLVDLRAELKALKAMLNSHHPEA